jgi:prophage antirepressor-like protein
MTQDNKTLNKEIDNLLVSRFGNLHITVYGTNANPLFKAKDIGDVLGIEKIRKTIENLDENCKVLQVGPSGGGLQNQWFLTEDGLYEVLFISRKPIAKQFKRWVRNVIKEIRLKGHYDLEQKIQEQQAVIDHQKQQLSRFKHTDYEPVEKNGHVYVISTDKQGVYKIGRSRNTKERVKSIQTNNVEDLRIEFDFLTSNDKLLEESIHYVLDRYRSNSNREHFWCNKDYIVMVIKLLGNVIDTLKSSYDTISQDKLLEYVSNNLLQGQSDPSVIKQNIIISQPHHSDSDTEEFNQDDLFWDWLDNCITYCPKKCVIKLIDIVQIYTGDSTFSKFNNQIMMYYKQQFQEYIKVKYPNIRHFQHTIRYNNRIYKGWNHLQFAN